MKRFLVAATGVCLILASPAGGGGVAAAASCALPKGAGSVPLVERNLATLERTLKGPDAAKIPPLRARLGSLRQRGEGFNAKAAPIERECQAIGSEMTRFKAARDRWKSAREPLIQQIKGADDHFQRSIKPRSAEIDRQRASNASLGCSIGKTFKLPQEKAAYERCVPLTASLNAKIQAYNRDLGQYKSKRAGLVSRVKALDAQYESVRKPLKARYDRYQADRKGYFSARKAWSDEVRQAWAQTTALQQQAQKAGQRPGGELGKLSGPFAPGSSGRSPGSGPIPPGKVVTGEGGAKGQAKAAAQTGKAGTLSKTGAGAAHEAGRVFDRGDVKVGGGGVVDARGVKPRPVPEAARRDPRWQAIERREQTFQARQAEAQKKVDAIQAKIQKGEGDKGRLQVELVKARQERSNAEANLNQVKYEKESFLIKLEEKPAAGAAGGK